jgi:hypothetical protein
MTLTVPLISGWSLRTGSLTNTTDGGKFSKPWQQLFSLTFNNGVEAMSTLLEQHCSFCRTQGL